MNKFLFYIFCLLLTSCGVKGDPMPPDEPVTLGRGQHNYKKATKGISLPEIPPAIYEDEEDEGE